MSDSIPPRQSRHVRVLPGNPVEQESSVMIQVAPDPAELADIVYYARRAYEAARVQITRQYPRISVMDLLDAPIIRTTYSAWMSAQDAYDSAVIEAATR